MRLLNRIFFLTLVLTCVQAHAAPLVTHEIDAIHALPKNSEPHLESTKDADVFKETLQWESTHPLSPEEKEQALHERKGLEGYENFDSSFRVGILSGVFDESNTQKIYQYAAYRLDFKKKPFETWQGEIKIGNSNFLHLNFGKKYLFLLEQIGAPYYKFSGGSILDSSGGIGSLFNFKRLQAMASMGLDDFFLLRHHLQMELGAGSSFVGPQIEASLGLAF